MLYDRDGLHADALDTREHDGNSQGEKGGAAAGPLESGKPRAGGGERNTSAQAHRAEVVSLHPRRRRLHDRESLISAARRDAARHWSKRATRARPPSVEQIEQRIETAGLVEREAFFETLCEVMRTLDDDAPMRSRAKALMRRLAELDLSFDDRVGVALLAIEDG